MAVIKTTQLDVATKRIKIGFTLTMNDKLLRFSVDGQITHKDCFKTEDQNIETIRLLREMFENLMVGLENTCKSVNNDFPIEIK